MQKRVIAQRCISKYLLQWSTTGSLYVGSRQFFTIMVHFILPHDCFFAISLSLNIHLEIFVKWSAAANGRLFYEIFNEHYLSLANFVFHSTWVFVKHSFQSWLLKSALVWVPVFFPSLCVFQFLFFSVAYREIGMTKRTKRILITFFFLSMKEVKYFQPVRVKLWIISFPFSWRRCQYIFVTNVINEKCSPLIVKCMLETQIVIAM